MVVTRSGSVFGHEALRASLGGRGHVSDVELALLVDHDLLRGRRLILGAQPADEAPRASSARRALPLRSTRRWRMSSSARASGPAVGDGPGLGVDLVVELAEDTETRPSLVGLAVASFD